MSNVWTSIKRVTVISGSIVLISLAGLIAYGFSAGSVEPVRAGLKLLAVVSLLAWLTNFWPQRE